MVESVESTKLWASPMASVSKWGYKSDLGAFKSLVVRRE